MFTRIPLGGLLGGLFLLGLTLVAFLSNLAALEVVVRSSSDMGLSRFSRGHIIVGLGIIEAILMIPSAFRSDVIETLDLVFGSGMQTLGSLMAIVGLTWGLGYIQTKMQLGERHKWLTGHRYFNWMKYVVPMALGLILLGYLLS